MADIVRITPEGHEEIRTGLGWRRVLSSNISEPNARLPVLDLSRADQSDTDDRKAVAKQVCAAAINSGFFYITGHGIPPDVVASIFAQTKRFVHGLSIEEKMEYDTEKHEHYYGYYPIKLDLEQPAGASTWMIPQ